MADVPYSENLIHCTSSQGNRPLKAVDGGGFLDNNITFTADQGYSFTKNGKYVITYLPTNAYGHGPSTKTIVPTDPKKFTITIETDQFDVDDGYGNHTSYSLTLEATKDAIVPTVNGFTNIYNPTQTDLNALASERYEVPAGDDKFKTYDYGQFITNLISVPFKIPTELIDKVDNIQLGNKKLNATSTKLNNHLLSIDIGSVKVVGKYQNLFDYKNVKCKIYCPYIEPIEIDVVDIMDKTLKITYLLDFYTGQANITITNSDNKIIYTDIKKVSNDLPFIQLSNNGVDKQQSAIFDNGIRKAYVEIIRNIPILNDKGYQTLERGKLKDYTGYIEVSDISLSTNASEQEQQEIEIKLRNGVKIKGDPGADGRTPYTHWAWAWSADGSDRFTTVYPGENYVLKSKEPYIATGNGTSNQYPNEIRYIPFNPDILGKKATIQYKVTISNYTSGTYLRLKMYDATGNWGGSSEWENITGNGTKLVQWKGTLRPLKDGGVPNIRFNTDLGANILIEELQIKEGLEYQIYTPAPSEDYANAYPTYTGTYTDYEPTGSEDSSKYTWSRVQGNEF